jgi:RHS repeat-associated protein
VKVVGNVGLTVLLSATAQASSYRFGAADDRVVSDEPHGYTQHITPEFEVQDGIAVTYARFGQERVARLVSTGYAAKVYTDVAPLDGADGKITPGDAWISQQASTGALSLAVTPTAVDRLLLSGARRILYESVPTTVYFAHDHLGSITVATDDQGAVVGRHAYYAWGGERASTGDGDSYGFTGQRHDGDGTVHFAFRQLDPATGRWSSTDPAFHVATPDGLGEFGEATTSYAYVANNPSNLFDPTGAASRLTRSKLGRAVLRIGRFFRNEFATRELAEWERAQHPRTTKQASNRVAPEVASHNARIARWNASVRLLNRTAHELKLLATDFDEYRGGTENVYFQRRIVRTVEAALSARPRRSWDRRDLPTITSSAQLREMAARNEHLAQQLDRRIDEAMGPEPSVFTDSDPSSYRVHP